MPSSARARVSLALTALVSAALALPALAESGIGQAGLLEPRMLLGTSDADVRVAAAAPRTTAVRIYDREALEKALAQEATGERERAESLPVPLDRAPDNAVGAADSDKTRGKLMHGLIDQYPQNPRCYVESHYIAAPPTCPN